MKMRIKLLAAVGAAAAVMMPAANAGASVGGVTGNFAGVASTSVSPLPVRCQPGSTSGTSTGTLNLSLTSDTSGAGSVGNLANANKVKASWPGGSLWLNRFGRTYKSSKSAKFPCPSTDTAPMTVVFQPYQGGRKVGSAAQVQTTVSWSGRRVVRQFAAVSSVGQIDLNCRANTKAKSLTTIKLEATRNTAGIDASLLGDDLNRATSLRATWNGGSAVLGRYERFSTVSSAARFPCPDPAKPGSRTLSITVQGYRGSAKVGAPAHINLGLYNLSDPGSQTTSGAVVGTSGGTVGSTSQPVSASNPVDTAVSLPPGVTGQVVIKESTSAAIPAPAGYSLLGAGVHVDAPPATVAAPLVLNFRVYAPQGTVNESTVKVFRNGEAAGECPAATTATPDPCVKSRSRAGDNILLTINTSHASEWGFAKATNAPS